MYYLSLIIPSYNEENMLEGVLNKVVKFLRKKKYKWEVVIVDDGSMDRTSEIAQSFEKEGVRLINLKRNQGKGAALRAGVVKSEGKFLVYNDADLSISIEHLDEMIKKLESSYSVVVGSRRIAGSKIVIHQPFFREKMGVVFTLLTKVIIGVNLPDFTCGFKGFKRDVAHDIFKRSLIDRWAYDAEIIFLASKMGYNIGQIPVSWKNRRETRVKLGSAILTSFLDLFRIRFNDVLGRYDKKI